MPDPIRVALIDDDAAVLDSLRLFLERRALAVTTYPSADAFLANRDGTQPFDCLVVDVRMPGTSGIDLVRAMQAKSDITPVILITGHGDVDMAVVAIKLGAFDFIEKPFDEERLLACIHNAASEGRSRQGETAEERDLQSRVEGLSERQRQVMDLAAAGLSNKEIGTRLGISPRTVEIHRAWMMERIGARNLAELVRITMRLKDAPR
jgi:two-component system response regulator FixJ